MAKKTAKKQTEIASDEATIPALTRSDLLSDDQRRTILTMMIRAREYDYAMQRLNRQGRAFGGVYSQIGNEATAVGSAYAMGEKDVLFPMHRNIGGHYVFGQDTRTLLLNQLAREGSMMRGTDGTGHYADPDKRIYGNISHLGSMIPVAAGFAMAARMRGEHIVTMTYIGDGGIQTGESHEGINFAAVQKLPMILIIENNQYAYSSPSHIEYACEKLSDRALGYGCYGITVDGTDIELVYETCKKAVEQARNGQGPALIECVTMRMRGHAEHDDFFYVPKETLEFWQKKDPVIRYEQQIIEWGIMTREDIDALRQNIIEELRNAIDEVVELPFPAAEEGYRSVFVD